MTYEDKPWWFIRFITSWQGGVTFWVVLLLVMVHLDWRKCHYDTDLRFSEIRACVNRWGPIKP